MSHPKTPKGQGHNQHDDTRQGSQEGADGGYGERSLPIQNTSFEQTSCDSFDEDYSMNADLFNMTYK